MASTASLSNVQEAVSLSILTSSLMGSLVVLPQMVPEQELPGLSVPATSFFKNINVGR